MYKFIREHRYIEEYYKFVYKHYAGNYSPFPVTYYPVDHENSVYDNDELLGGSYDHQGIGNLSGYKFKKILLFPVFGIDPIQLQMSSGESGISFKDGGTIRFTFTSLFGLIPIVGDYVDLSFGLQLNNLTNILFQITNVNKSNMGDLEFFQCVGAISTHTTDSIEKQLSSYWYFVESENKILHWDNAKVLIKLEERNEDIITSLNSSFDNLSGFYYHTT